MKFKSDVPMKFDKAEQTQNINVSRDKIEDIKTTDWCVRVHVMMYYRRSLRYN